jgi:hypothetical protein
MRMLNLSVFLAWSVWAFFKNILFIARKRSKGLDHEIKFKYFDKKWICLSIKCNSLSIFRNWVWFVTKITNVVIDRCIPYVHYNLSILSLLVRYYFIYHFFSCIIMSQNFVQNLYCFSHSKCSQISARFETNRVLRNVAINFAIPSLFT